jgi:hypothetical protein
MRNDTVTAEQALSCQIVFNPWSRTIVRLWGSDEAESRRPGPSQLPYKPKVVGCWIDCPAPRLRRGVSPSSDRRHRGFSSGRFGDAAFQFTNGSHSPFNPSLTGIGLWLRRVHNTIEGKSDACHRDRAWLGCRSALSRCSHLDATDEYHLRHLVPDHRDNFGLQFSFNRPFNSAAE